MISSTTPIYTYVFQPAWTYLFPKVVPEFFHFPSRDATVRLPFSTIESVLVTLAVYVVLVHLGQWLFRQRWMPTLQLRPLFFLHNSILSAISLLLLLMILENLGPRLLRHGLMWGVCHEDVYESDHRLEFFFYLNYLCKFYEFFDTFFLVVKKKKVEFLHWYHHSMTMLLCYTQLVGRTSASWVPITLNLWVHIIMYYYYARTSVSKKPIWWKKYLTTLQIIQFVVDLAVINFALYVRHAAEHQAEIQKLFGVKLPQVNWDGGLPALPKAWKAWLPSYVMAIKPYKASMWSTTATAHGSLQSGYFGWLILNSYLVLFIQFYRKTYRRAASSKTKTQ